MQDCQEGRDFEKRFMIEGKYLWPVPDEWAVRCGWVLLGKVVSFTDGRARRTKVSHLTRGILETQWNKNCE